MGKERVPNAPKDLMFLLVGKLLHGRNILEVLISFLLFDIEDMLKTIYRVLSEVNLSLIVEGFLSSCLSLLLLLDENRVPILFLIIS